ncbi:MAG: hypothetical protein R3C17_02625 [Planctomycetaceae bacterium]
MRNRGNELPTTEKGGPVAVRGFNEVASHQLSARWDVCLCLGIGAPESQPWWLPLAVLLRSRKMAGSLPLLSCFTN